MGGNDDAFLIADREVDGGQEIGEGLAHAGAGFDEEVMALGEGLFDSRRHFKLLGTMLVAVAEASGDRGARAEDVSQGGGHERPRVGFVPSAARDENKTKTPFSA